MANPIEQISRLIIQSRNRQLETFSYMHDIEALFRYHNQAVIENWWFYHGYHNLFMKRWRKEENSDFIERVQSATIENHIKPVINLMVSHLYSGEEAVKRYVTRSNKPDDELQKILEESVWNWNDFSKVDDPKALNTLVSGFTVLQRRFVDLRTMEEFSVGSNPRDILKYGVVIKIPLDSAFTLPIPYINQNGFKDYTRFGGILYIADSDNFIGHPDVMKLMKTDLKNQKIMEYVTDQLWLRWVKVGDKDEWKQHDMFPGTKFTNRNPYGKITIPFTLYRNTGDAFAVEGTSDVNDLKSLNMELNQLGNGDKDTILYHQDPILQGRNAAKLPNNFVRTKNAVIDGLPKDAYFEYVTWDGKLDVSMDRQEALRRAFSHVSGMSMIARGFLKDIGQIRSGPPLKALFTSDRTTMSRKFEYFRSGEKAEMMADLELYKFHTKVNNIDIDKTVKFNVKFRDDFLGIDKLLEEEVRALEVQSGTEDIEEIIKEKHPDWSEADIKKSIAMMKEIRETKSKSIKASSSDKKGIEQE